MRLRAGIAVVVASLLLVGVAGGAPPRPLVLGISWEGAGMLAWLDARTLAPTGRRVDIGPPPTGIAARSPDGRTIALGSGVKRLNLAKQQGIHLLRCSACHELANLDARGWRIALEADGATRALCPRCER